MLLRFIEKQEIPIRKAAEIVMNSLPVCKVRKISYSTFSIIDVNDEGVARIIEEGNPEFLWIKNGEIMDPPFETIQSKTFQNRCMKSYKIGDRLIFCSDGVTQCGLGNGRLKLGLRRDGLIELVLAKLKEEPEISSSELSRYIIRQTQNIETDIAKNSSIEEATNSTENDESKTESYRNSKEIIDNGFFHKTIINIYIIFSSTSCKK